MYAFVTAEGGVDATAKGIKMSAIKQLRWENYHKALFGQSEADQRQEVEFNVIRSRTHQLCSMHVSKAGLCGFDDKWFVLADSSIRWHTGIGEVRVREGVTF
jgi:hypothetical protein